MALTIGRGNLMGGLAGLIQKRRAMRGSSFGSAINTQPQGPPIQPLAQAATTSPAPPTNATGAGQPGQAQPVQNQIQQADQMQGRSAPQSNLGEASMGKRMGKRRKESLAGGMSGLTSGQGLT